MLPGGKGPTTYRWWLRLQLAFTVAGGGAWVVGAVIEEAFLTGAGAGLILAALGLRLGRRAAGDSPHRSAEDARPRRGESPEEGAA